MPSSSSTISMDAGMWGLGGKSVYELLSFSINQPISAGLRARPALWPLPLAQPPETESGSASRPADYLQRESCRCAPRRCGWRWRVPSRCRAPWWKSEAEIGAIYLRVKCRGRYRKFRFRRHRHRFQASWQRAVAGWTSLPWLRRRCRSDSPKRAAGVLGPLSQAAAIRLIPSVR